MNEIIRLYLAGIIRHSLVLLVLVFSLSFPGCRTSVEMTPETWVAFSEDTKIVILGTLHEGIPIMGNLPTFIVDAIIGAEIILKMKK